MAYDVIVVGVGSMGAATCSELAARGVRVLGLGAGALPNPIASFAGRTRAIRLSYSEHPDYVPLLRGAYRRWEKLGEECGQQFLHLTGALYMGPETGELFSGALASAQMHELPHTRFTGAELHREWPQFCLPENFVGLHESQAGYVLSEAAVLAMVKAAQRHGAKLCGHEPVLDWAAAAQGVTVRTAQGEYAAGHLIFTAGAWTPEVLRDLPLTVTRQVLGWTQPPDLVSFTADRFPVWAIDHAGPGFYYGFPHTPDGSGGPGLKAALHCPGAVTTAAAAQREPLPADAEEVRAVFARHLPAGDGPLIEQRTCLYTNTPDGHFIVDRYPAHERVTLACGFSGHGFKFASVMGTVLADLATIGKTDWPIGFLGLSRFAHS
ncbi:MAG: N-methyl-L-tryptophan oxidase [Verrucomicrobia subdivision 3 bacterium]|nr:N-methyl-L-tryptophan oxidase [Limisphaerales bacterium]